MCPSKRPPVRAPLPTCAPVRRYLYVCASKASKLRMYLERGCRRMTPARVRLRGCATRASWLPLLAQLLRCQSLYCHTSKTSKERVRLRSCCAAGTSCLLLLAQLALRASVFVLCISKASKLRTCSRSSCTTAARRSRRRTCSAARSCSWRAAWVSVFVLLYSRTSGVSFCTFVLEALTNKTIKLWTCGHPSPAAPFCAFVLVKQVT